MPLSKLYVTPLDGAFTVIVPVETEHVGWVTVTVGAAIVGQQIFVIKGSETAKQPTKVEILFPAVTVGVGDKVLSYVNV